MQRTRKIPYYYLNDIGELKPDVDNGSERDKARYKVGNYFLNRNEAREKQKAFFSLLSKRNLVEKVKALII